MIPPFNFMKWVDENRAALQPPVCNKTVYNDGDFIIMAIGGPNSRKDYHDDPGDEFFYQLVGDMTLRIMENDTPKDIEIKEGEMFLLPAHVHHSPQRKANTVGLVIERKRKEGEEDGFLWYCDKCHTKLHEEKLLLENIVKDLPPIFDRFWNNEEARKCPTCDYLMPLPESRK